ncbi:hypothetical protein EMIHUDRAFT_46753, partial [Emiliania huxleyi CCMP1516]|uniref:Ubiquitin-like protease family profile domain-containing protein n=2 Tax=Emiliania huxleyi TaxID=2903 RepID=A0A0D3IYU9_EMIH1
PKVHVFSTHFYTKLAECAGGYNHKNVSRWTRKVDLFAMDLIIVPINQGNTHWVLAAINVRERRFEYYDSMGGDDDGRLKNLRMYLVDECAHKKHERLDLEATGWADYYGANHGAPRQTDGFSCGVYVAITAECLRRGAALDLENRRMQYFREKLTAELLRGALL